MSAARTSVACATSVMRLRADGCACDGWCAARAMIVAVSEGLAQPQASSLIKPLPFIYFHFQYETRPARSTVPLRQRSAPRPSRGRTGRKVQAYVTYSTHRAITSFIK